MNHSIPNDLDLPTAKRVVDRAFEEYERRFASYQPTLRWADERTAEIGFHAKGFQLGGSMRIEDKSIEVELDVPWLLRPFRSMALEVIEREVRLWLDKARAGEL